MPVGKKPTTTARRRPGPRAARSLSAGWLAAGLVVGSSVVGSSVVGPPLASATLTSAILTSTTLTSATSTATSTATVATSPAPVVRTPADRAHVPAADTAFTGTGVAGAVIDATVVDFGTGYGTATVDADGGWRIAPPGLDLSGTLHFSFVQQVPGEAVSAAVGRTVTYVPPPPPPAPRVLSPGPAARVFRHRVLVTGLGVPGDTVVVIRRVVRDGHLVDADALGETTVRRDHHWSVRVGPFPFGPLHLGAIQTNPSDISATTPRSFFITPTAPVLAGTPGPVLIHENQQVCGRATPHSLVLIRDASGAIRVRLRRSATTWCTPMAGLRAGALVLTASATIGGVTSASSRPLLLTVRP